MAIASVVTGPGTLTFSSPAGTFSSQITSLKVTTSVKRGDALKVLSGEEIPPESNYSAQLEGSCLQDLTQNGFVEFTWKNMGKETSFVFEPNKALGAAVSGKVLIDPISIGGKVGERATSDFSFACVGMPKFDPKARK